MNQCYCDRSSGMYEHGHRHGGVDSMPVAMQYVPWHIGAGFIVRKKDYNVERSFQS